MIYTKEEFKRLWEADIDGKAVDGITSEDSLCIWLQYIGTEKRV